MKISEMQIKIKISTPDQVSAEVRQRIELHSELRDAQFLAHLRKYLQEHVDELPPEKQHLIHTF